MMDGWRLRHRGDDWGLQPAGRAGDRVAWQECKSAVIYRTAQAVNKNDRGLPRRQVTKSGLPCLLKGVKGLVWGKLVGKIENANRQN